MNRARFLISGKVQGVFFRAAARHEALRLGLHGHARNLSDGGVEVIAKGSDEALHELERWLQHGPPDARVDAVQRFRHEDEIKHGFMIF